MAFALLASACAIAPADRILPELTAAPDSFEVSGRIALRQGDRSDIAKLRWTHTAAMDRWVIASPLGNEVARIEADLSGARLERAGEPVERAASFADLSQRLLGVALDPAELARWLHGVRPAAAGEWTVAIEETQQAGAVRLARRLSASRGDVTVRLVVDEYRSLEGKP